MTTLSTYQTNMIIRLYEAMPGAPMPPKEGGYYCWGDIEGNDHWLFCERIVRLVLDTLGEEAKARLAGL